ncbi:DNA-binding SARP family transcriptional activator [Saccharothrix carnea]|uniref:DNA-binding SARP family transcriptional activator n=1 Tax=Saccharothrix carnea TaxID=1280637 RepID=A0A2P8IBL3_SACCR|nr:DNA-binding SARP family transcriptional activator [Saccharothrix carnea]
MLGNLEIRVGDVPVPIGHNRQKSVLVALLTEVGRVVSVDRLIDRVWGEHPPARARSVLRTYLANLRRALTSTGIVITWRDTGYQVTVDPDRVDVHRFRRLLTRARGSDDPRRALALTDEALGLWRGEPLAELDTPWAQSAREHLYRERDAARADRIDWALECGRHGELLPELTTRAAEDPLDERLAGQLMLALYRAGRPAEALEHYQHVRQRLAEELGTDPGPAVQQLHQRILTADRTLTLPGTDPAPEQTTGRVPPPRQLPAAPAPFVGRHEELDGLDAALDASGQAATVVISALAGAGGIGKTWLALHWAHRHTDRFPDGQLFVDLRGFSPEGEPMNPAVAVRGFLDALGVDPGRIPVDLDAQAALYRSLVAGKRMLVVLDNAATADQVAPLLPGTSTGTVLITGRTTLALLIDRHGARHLQLGILTHDEAHTLLARRIGDRRVAAEPVAARELVDLCGRYPLALSIMSRYVSTRPHVPLAEFAAELRELGVDMFDNDDPAVSLPAVLSWSLRGLTDEQRTAFALLGIAPGPDIDLPAAASLTGLPVARTRKVLRALEEHSLLERHPHDRYSMHDLIRAYATTTAHDDLPQPVRRAALDRVVDFYLHTAHTADHHLYPHRGTIQLDPPAVGAHPHPLPDHATALAWMDTHHAHLLAAQHTAAAHCRHQPVWHFAWLLGAFHQTRGHRHDDLAVWQAGLDAAAHLPDPAARIRAHRFLGRTYIGLGQHDEAIGHLRQALVLAEHHHDSSQRALTHHALARAWGQRGDDRQALNHARQALDDCRGLDQPAWEADALNTVGWYSARLGDYDTARDHCQAALILHRRHRHTHGEAYSLDSLGFIDHRTGHHHQAIRHYNQALSLRRTFGHTYEVVDSLDALGHPHAALGDHAQARAVWREALDLYRQQGRDTDAERVQRQLDDLDKPTGAGQADA